MNTTPDTRMNFTPVAQNRTHPTGMNANQQSNEAINSVFLILYILVALIGLIGNCLTVYVIIKQKFMRKSIHFYTLNLALADLLVILFYVPVEVVKNENNMLWTMGESLCRINYCVIPLSVVASISTLIAITVNRHRGVTKPLQWRSDTRSAIKISIPLIWLAGLITCIPFLFVVVLEEYPAGSGNYYCYEDWGSKNKERAYWVSMFCLQVVIPLIIMIILNTRMLVIMSGYRNNHKRSHKRIIRLVVALVVVYAICTSPQHVVYFWLSYGDISTVGKHVQVTIFKLANLLIIIQMAVNPIIYGTIGELRRSFSTILSFSKFRAILSFRQEQSDKEESNPVIDLYNPDYCPPVPETNQLRLTSDERFNF